MPFSAPGRKAEKIPNPNFQHPRKLQLPTPTFFSLSFQHLGARILKFLWGMHVGIWRLPVLVFRLDHFPEFDCRLFNIVMLVLAGSALHGKNGGPMHVFEIAVRKFVSRFGILGMPLVNSQMPFCVIFKPVQANELVFVLRRRLMSGPSTFAISNEPSR